MNANSIFFETPQDSKQENKVTYCDFLDEDKFVSQFLNAEDLHFDVCQNLDVEPMAEIFSNLLEDPQWEAIDGKLKNEEKEQ